MIWPRWALGALAAVAAVWAGLALYGGWRWQARTATGVAALAAARMAPEVRRYDPAMLEGLPPPVARYLRVALVPGQPVVTSVQLAHTGTFNMGEATDSWKPFTSEQWVEVARPGFLWNGTVMMAPGLPVRVHDAYVAGEGRLVPAILGLIKLADIKGGGAIAEGEAMRWLAEAPWYPTALLPGGAVSWTPIDDRSALATLHDGAVTVSLTFRFGAEGLVESIRAEARGRTLGGKIVSTPWEGRWSGYARRDGMKVPMAGEVAWMLPEGDKPYWRGEITRLVYGFAD